MPSLTTTVRQTIRRAGAYFGAQPTEIERTQTIVEPMIAARRAYIYTQQTGRNRFTPRQQRRLNHKMNRMQRSTNA